MGTVLAMQGADSMSGDDSHNYAADYRYTPDPAVEPPQTKPHPPSDPDNTGLPALFEWVSGRPELIEKLQFLKRETERLGS